MADQAREEEFYYLLTEGSELLQAGKVDDARKHFERALEMNPSHEQALNLLGLSLFRLNHLDRARQIFADLVHNNPIEPSLRLNLAMVHLKTGHLTEAKIELERVLELSPDHPRATSYMGLVLERQGDLDRAATYYEKAGNKKRADEIRAFRPTQTGTFPLPNLRQLVSQPPTSAPGPAAMAASTAAARPSPTAPTATAATTTAPKTPAPSTPPSTPPTPAVPKPITAVTPLDNVASTGSASAKPNADAEAAALTAAAASHLRRPTDPPEAARVESARGASLGYTIEVEETRAQETTPAAAPASAKAAAPARAQTPEARPSTPPSAAGTSTPPGAAQASAGPTLSQLPVWTSAPEALREERLSDLIALATIGDLPARRGDDGALSFPVPDVGYVRTDLLIALAGSFEIETVNRRYRGKRTDSLFGGPDASMIALLGKGCAFLAPDKLALRLVALKNEELYLVESALVAFSQGLVWENGRLPSETDRDLDIVHLRGSGRALLGTKSPLIVLPVRADQPVTVHASRLIGWNGQLVPYRAPLPGLPENGKRVPVVRFEGTGIVLAL